MAFGVLRKLVGDPNERALKQIAPLVGEINELEPEITALSDEALRERTDRFRARLQRRRDARRHARGGARRLPRGGPPPRR